MYSPEFKAEALKVLEECGGSCTLAARKLKVVCAKTIYRWKSEATKPPKRCYSHLSVSQKKAIARKMEHGASASELADKYGVATTTIYNIRNGFSEKGARAFMDHKEIITVSPISTEDMPNDIEDLKKRCAELEMDKAILEQTIEILKKT